MSTVTLTTRGPFSLAQTRAFLEGWSPADARLSGGVVRLGFALDDGEHAAAALVTQDGDEVRAELQTDGDEAATAAQLARMLSLDIDATGWPEAGRRDPVLGELQARRPGFRPFLFGSPFEAAVWALLSQRTGRRQAAVVRRRSPRSAASASTSPASGCTSARRCGSSSSTGCRAFRRRSSRVCAPWPTPPSTDVWTPPTFAH